MMANDVNYSSRRIQRCVKSERDAGITRYDSLLACQILVPLVFADTSTSLQVCCRRWHRTTTATHYRASNSFPLKKKKKKQEEFIYDDWALQGFYFLETQSIFVHNVLFYFFNEALPTDSPCRFFKNFFFQYSNWFMRKKNIAVE